MNADTTRSVNQTIESGYYLPSMTLGEGGWPYLNKNAHIYNWSKYTLLLYTDDADDSIFAKDDESAVKAFHSLYRLDSHDYTIIKTVMQVSTVESSFE
jgi:hypothetical protein